MPTFRKRTFGSSDLSDTSLEKAKAIGARFRDANLARADLMLADLANADLCRANLENAVLLGANLSGARLCEVTGLAQGQLDQASRQGTTEPPDLHGSHCAETGRALIWKDDG